MDVRAKVATTVNSDGIWMPSVSVYFSGCDNPSKCPHCHNPELQDPLHGALLSLDNLISDITKKIDMLRLVFDKVAIAYVGGEPLAPYNIDSMSAISKLACQKYPIGVAQLAYTWRYLEDINQQKLWGKLCNLDYLVCGPFIEELSDLDYTPASSNQYIYDVKHADKIAPVRRTF